MIKKSIECGFFEEVSFVDELSFLVLQYADGTIIMCKNTRMNLWCLKAVLRVFEMAFGPRVNFHKKCPVGLYVELDELNTAAHFLN